VTRVAGAAVRPAVPSDFPAIAELLDRTFGQRPYSQRLALWKWRCEDNPARTEAFPSFLVLADGGRIVGVHGLIPLRLKVADRTLTVSCSCDLAVDPLARSGGMRLKLAAMTREIAPLHLSTSANEPANRITLALGGRELTCGRRKHILPLKASGLLLRGWRLPAGTALAGFLLKPADWLLEIARCRRSCRPGPGMRFREIEHFDERFDLFWQDLAAEFPGIQSYEVCVDGRLLGFAVIQLGSDEDRLRFAAILELAVLKSGEGVLETLIAEAVRRAASAGAHYVVARAPSAAYEGAVARAGFRLREARFSPVTFRYDAGAPSEYVAQDGNWYLSLGDGDGCHYFPEECAG
jgi:hypothetical protein